MTPTNTSFVFEVRACSNVVVQLETVPGDKNQPLYQVRSNHGLVLKRDVNVFLQYDDLTHYLLFCLLNLEYLPRFTIKAQCNDRKTDQIGVINFCIKQVKICHSDCKYSAFRKGTGGMMTYKRIPKAFWTVMLLNHSG